MKKKCLKKTITWHSLPNETREDETSHKEEEIITSIQEKEASSLQETCPYNNKNGPGPQNSPPS